MTGFRNSRLFSTTLIATASAAIFLFGLQSRANALSLQLTSGIFNTTVNDPGNTGQVLFAAPFANFTVNVSFGTSKPTMGSASAPHMDLSSFTLAGAGGGTLTIMLSDTGFTGTGGLLSFINNIGGTLTPATLTVQTYLDPTNTLFGLTTLLTSQSFGSTAFSGTANGVGTTNASPYSLTEVITLTLPGGGSASFDSDLQATPIPAALPLFVSGLGALGFAAYRRKRKALAV